MEDFKVGDKVVWNGKTDSKSLRFYNNMEDFLKSKEIHTIRDICNNEICRLEGFDYWLVLNWFDLVEEEKPKFKVGDKVKWKGKKDSDFVPFFNEKENFLKSKKVHTISEISPKRNACKIEGDAFWYDLTWYDLNWFELVEEPNFEVGEEVEATNNKLYWTSKGMYTFYSYDETLDYPYLVKRISTDGKTFISSFKYCRKTKKYKAYTEFNADWIGKKIDFNSVYEWEIVGWKDDKVLLSDSDEYSTVSLEELVNDYTFNGKPFGEEIK